MPRRCGLSFAVLAALGTLAIPGLGRALAQDQPDPAIERLVDDWYAEQCAGERGRPYRLMAPGGIDASPGYRYRDTGSAALGPRDFVSLAATAPLFRYEITRVRADAWFAKVQVRERGYRYASAAGKTYELMSNAVLVVERQDDGRWLVLAHETNSTGFPPSLATDSLPDLGPERAEEHGPLPAPGCSRFRSGEFR